MNGTVLYPAVIPWGDLPGEGDAAVTRSVFSVRQRPQHLMTAFARSGLNAVFVDCLQGKPQCWQIEPNLSVVRNVADTPGIVRPLYLWVSYPPTAAQYVRKYKPDYVVYDCIDDATEEFSSWKKEIPHVAAVADIIFASAKKLFDQHSVRYPEKTHLLMNGVDYNHMQKRGPRPSIYSGEKILLYVGAIASWIDWKMFDRAAAILQGAKWQTVIVGPNYNVGGSSARMKNATYAGYVPYPELPSWYGNASVFAAPFRDSVMLEGCNPLKVWESLAAGTPVVGTPIRELESMHPYVRTASTPADFADCVASAYLRKECERKFIMRYARDNDWMSRADTAMSAMKRLEVAR